MFKSDSKWKSGKPDPDKPNLTDFFTQKGAIVDQMIEFFDKYPCEIKLNDLQWEEMDSVFSELLNKVSQSDQNDSESVVKRMGIIFFRICMIFTALRKFQGRITDEVMDCHPNDFHNAMTLITVYMQHNFTLLGNLKSSPKNHYKQLSPKIREIFDKIPRDFRRKDAVEVGKSIGVSVRRVDQFLNESKKPNGILESTKAGFYSKKDLL